MINRAYNASCEIEFSDVTNFTQIRGLLVKVNYPNFDERNSINQVSAQWQLPNSVNCKKKGATKGTVPFVAQFWLIFRVYPNYAHLT